MRKIISLALSACMLLSIIPIASATRDYTQGTQVVYTSSGTESYTITVPALLAPGGDGTVTLSGTWAENRVVTVTAESTVTLKNSIKETDTKTLNVNFDGISEAGSNTGSQTFTKSVSVDNITNAIFGTWSGKFNYNVEISDVSTSIMYSYNGHILPKIPDETNDKPYVQMMKMTDEMIEAALTKEGMSELIGVVKTAYLVAYSSHPLKHSGDDIFTYETFESAVDGAIAHTYIYSPDMAVNWTFVDEVITNDANCYSTHVGPVVWSNYDMTLEDGSMHMAASEPVPVVNN